METFRASFTGWRISSEGYRVKGMSRSSVRYEDGQIKLDVAAEMLVTRPRGYVIYADSIPLDSPISRKEVLDRIVRAFASDGSRVEIARA